MAPPFNFHHYLPVNDDAMAWGIYVTGAGRERIEPGEEYPPRKHPSLYQFDWSRGRTLPEFQVVLITEGHGIFESQPTGELAIEQGRLVCLFPGIWHRYRPDPQTGWTERWFSFNGEIIYRLIDQGLFRKEASVQPIKRPANLARAFDRYLERIHAHPTLNSVLLSLHMMKLLAEVIESIGASEQVTSPTSVSEVEDPLVAQAIDLIWTRSHQPLPIAQIARLLNVNRRTLERRFIQSRGHSVLQEVHNCRIGRAKRLLVETDLPIKTVCHLAGFSSDERMRVAFVEREGMPPTAYREQYRRTVK